MNLFNHEKTISLFNKLLSEAGVEQKVIDNFVPAIVRTSLRGVDSHGINLFPHYYNCFIQGRLNKKPTLKFDKKSASSIVTDADSAIGHHSSVETIKELIKLAKETGISIGFVKNSTHYGAAFHYAELAAKEGMAAFSFTNADSLVRAVDSKESLFGTNPFCFAIPMNNEDPLVVDMSTSVVSWNKVKNHRISKAPLLPGWACDGNGQPTTDPDAATMLNPTGGYKGYILGMVVDVLCAFFTENPAAREIKPMFSIPLSEKRNIGHCFIVIDINKFIPLNSFKERVSSMAKLMRALPPLSKDSAPVAPGDPEKKAFEERIKTGIPVSNEKYKEFLAVSPEFAAVLV